MRVRAYSHKRVCERACVCACVCASIHALLDLFTPPSMCGRIVLSKILAKKITLQAYQGWTLTKGRVSYYEKKPFRLLRAHAKKPAR